MKIILLTNQDIASNLATNLLLPHLKNHDVSVFLSAQVGKAVPAKSSTDAGSSMPQAATAVAPKPRVLNSLKFFEQTLFNQFVTPALNSAEQNPAAFKTFAQMSTDLIAPVELISSINSAENVSKITALAPDLIISIRFGGILKQPIINIPKFGVINLHSGLLPHYRGVMATFWAMLNGERTIGTTLHYISDGSIDTGNIIANTELTVDCLKSYLWHVLQLYFDGCQQIVKTVNAIADGTPIATRPQPTGGKYFTFPTDQEFTEFANKNLVLVDEQELVTFIHKHYHLSH